MMPESVALLRWSAAVVPSTTPMGIARNSAASARTGVTARPVRITSKTGTRAKRNDRPNVPSAMSPR